LFNEREKKRRTHMAFIDVKNKKGTAGNTPPSGCNSWLDFWEKKKGGKATQCEVMSCKGSPNLGGHVIKVGEGSKEYILPMCYTCNNKPENEVFKVWDTDLVPVT
jgi:hypothetical protein